MLDAGFSALWTSQIFGYDALTALAVVGREVPDVELGTAVVPTYPRHPVMLAQQALTVQAHKFSGKAAEKLAAAGGKAEAISS